MVITAATGTPLLLTFESLAEPGRPLSRENAKHIRDALVRQATPQNSWPRVEISTITLVAVSVSALSKMASEPPPPSFTAPTSVAAKVMASSTSQPISAE